MMRARKIQSPGAWRLPASLRIFRSSSMFWGARACSSFGTISSLPARRSSHALMYTAFEERSTSLPGIGPILGAEFLVAVGDIRALESADRLAAYAGLVPAARDSGKRVGNKRMRGGNKVLKRVFYQSAFASLRSAPESRAFYDRKRAEGKRHTQALIAL